MAQSTDIRAEPNAVVNIQVDAAYDDSDRSLRILETIAQYAPYRKILVIPGNTLDDIFIREFGFGRSDLPKAYAVLLRQILRRNHLATPQDLRPGSLIIPTIPKRVTVKRINVNITAYFASMEIFPALAAHPADRSTNRAAVSGIGTLADKEPSDVVYDRSVSAEGPLFFSQHQLLQFGMPISVAKKLLEDKAFEADTVTAATFPLPVRLADNTCDGEDPTKDHQVLSSQQEGELARFLEQQSQRPTSLFVPDTGWPSYEAYAESRAALYAILDKVWQNKFGLTFPQPRALKEIPTAKNEHCRCIERALKELRRLETHVDDTRRVSVIYIPLTREQNSKTILTDLLQTSNLLERLAVDHTTLSKQIVSGARARAGNLVDAYFPAEWSGQEVNTDKSVLDALLLIGQAYAELSNTAFVVSESWTVKHEPYGGKYYVNFQTPQYGIVASAAGNDRTTNLLDFAQRSTSTNDTIAVMNITSSGIAPLSTRVPAADIDIAEAVGFDGTVTDDISGTSFSAPRVAWFLAAGEAVRKSNANLEHWAIDLRARLKSLRNPNADRYQQLLFDPVRYVKAQE